MWRLSNRHVFNAWRFWIVTFVWSQIASFYLRITEMGGVLCNLVFWSNEKTNDVCLQHVFTGCFICVSGGHYGLERQLLCNRLWLSWNYANIFL
jgi:hypothetical protein